MSPPPAEQHLGNVVVHAQVRESAEEQPATVQGRMARPHDQQRLGFFNDQARTGAEDSGAKPDRRQVSLAHAPHGHDKPELPRCQSGLVGMGRHRRVAQRRRLG
jgi:hypothetical protein